MYIKVKRLQEKNPSVLAFWLEYLYIYRFVDVFLYIHVYIRYMCTIIYNMILCTSIITIYIVLYTFNKH